MNLADFVVGINNMIARIRNLRKPFCRFIRATDGCIRFFSQTYLSEDSYT